MLFPHQLDFDPADAAATLAQLPSRPAVFALRGTTGEPYLNRTPDLRRRLSKLLTPAPAQSKRLALAGLVRTIQWAETASEFSAQLLLYQAALASFGERARARLHLSTPFFLRMGMRNRFPRLWVTNNITLAAAQDFFGPFSSRHAAERYAEQLLDLHLLRRCFQDLDPEPSFPGCIYSEMHKCLAPCFGGCSDERYSEEAAAVHAFLRTRGQSLLATLAAEREQASVALDFEAAAAVHARYSKAEDVAALAPELAGALSGQVGILVQPDTETDHVALYLLRQGVFTGPVRFSVLGMRLPNEQSGSSSLFAHPAAIAPVPLGASVSISNEPGNEPGNVTPEDRLLAALGQLQEQAQTPDKQQLGDHQSLLARWYFRPQGKREGELLLADPAEPTVPIKPLLRACARVFRAHAERHAPAQASPML